MDIDGIERCPRCFSVWDQAACTACGHRAGEGDGAPGSHLAPETILQGRFLIGSVLGAGGFGITYAAWDLKLDAPVAIKEYFPSGLASRDTSATDGVSARPEREAAQAFATGLNRFIREARVLALFNEYADIVAIRDCIEENDTAYIVMEYLRGMTLQAHAAASGGRVSPRELMGMMRSPIETLGKIHESGMLHRDVSPANLMLQPDGRVKLIDFGAVMGYDLADAGQSATMILNRRFAAPEQFQPDGAMGPWTDVYGCCATLYTLLTGKTPREAAGGRGGVPPLRGQGVAVTRRQERAILHGLAENPRQRVQSIPELMSPLYGVPLPEELRRRKRLVRTAAGAVAAMALLSLALLANAFRGFPGGDGAFYRLGFGGASLLRYEGDAAAFTGRDRFWGVPVTEIGPMAFTNNEKLTEVTIGESVSRVGDFAFAGCGNLQTVRVPDGAELMEGVFDGCGEGLTLYGAMDSLPRAYARREGLRFCDPSLFEAAVLPEGAAVLSMAEPADASALSHEIVIPPSLSGVPVTVIDTGDRRFPATRRIVFPDTARRIGTDAFGWNSNDPDGWRAELEEVVLPEGLEVIGDGAFQSSGLRSLVIPDTVTDIGRSAFTDCPLESVRLPASLTSLGAWAFGACRMTGLRLPDGLAEVEEYTFYHCKELAEITFPASLRAIGRYAFMGCASIREIILPDKTESIGDEAFRDCYQLSRAVLPESVTFIGTDAFRTCAPDLTFYGHAGSFAEAYARENGIPFVDVGRWTPAEAFACETGAEGVTVTGYAGDFPEVVIPDYIGGVAVTKLADGLFAGASNLRAVTVPSPVTALPRELFAQCVSLVSVTLPDGLRAIEDDAFGGCLSLPSLTIPSGVSFISVLAFEDCRSLKTLVFAEGTRRIDALGEASLEAAVIPESVTYISPGSFKWIKSTLTLRGVSGSYAEAWARENGVAFEGAP